MMKRIGLVLLLLLCALAIAAATGWGALAIFYSDIKSEDARTALAAAFGVAGLVAVLALCLRRWRWRAAGTFIVLLALLIAWWSRIEPSNDRDWQTDVAVLPYATIDGDRYTVHNVRNFDYRTETDFTPHYYDRTFDLNELQGVDLVASYWMGPAIAHIFVSFDFGSGKHLAVSIETRKEKNEAYSTIKGFFRQYELYYVVADERDVIRVRTNYRKDPPEDVYVYRVHGPIENGRRTFMEYMREINALKAKPEFYNTLTTNCTTTIWMNTRVNPGHVPFSWKVLASGYVPDYLYEIGRLDTSVPFEELRRRSHVNARAQAADKAANFSELIRKPAPGG